MTERLWSAQLRAKCLRRISSPLNLTLGQLFICLSLITASLLARMETRTMTLPTTTSASSIKSGHGENSSDPELAVPAATPVGTAPLYSKKRLMLQEASCHATMLIAGWYAPLCSFARHLIQANYFAACHNGM